MPDEIAPQPQTVRAAGVLYLSSAGHVLLVHRTDGQGWAFPGGHIEDGETSEDAARREFTEEVGQKCDGRLTLWTRRVMPPVGSCDPVATVNGGTGAAEIAVASSVDFTTYLCRGPEFEPKLNAEHDAWQWVDRSFALSSTALHPGVYIALQRFDMDELGVSRAIVTGELTSPQRYKNLLLIAIRITGTGAAYRTTGDEFVWRDPSIYMNDEFLQRCNGLFVILNHPPDKPTLDTDQFRKRIVGSVFLPFLKPEINEVWGVAKIADMDIAELLENEPVSTSPGVLFLKSELRRELATEDGKTIVIEGEPCLLDHIALCPYGVWDKGGDPAGVDSIEARHDSIDEVKLDTMLRLFKLDEFHRRVSRF
jgi:8-oxo-dGTP pyrophosphatase MutT (NUDIX family)